MAHTPGPWKANKYGGIGGGELGLTPLVVLADGLTDTTKEDFAMLLAAPDLLAACETALAVLEQDWEGDEPSITGDMLRAAIAKSKGEMP